MPKIIITLLFLVVALIFLQAVFHASPLVIGRYLVAQVGSAIGVTVHVPVNPFNILAQQFKEKESSLSEKESELLKKEADLKAQANEKQRSQNKILIFIGAVGGILLVLILANFYFDYRRRKI